MSSSMQITFRKMPRDEDVASLARSEAENLMRHHDEITWIHTIVTRQHPGYEVKVIVQVPGYTLVERHYADDEGAQDPLSSVARAFESTSDMLLYHEGRRSTRQHRLEPVFAGNDLH
jgi:hypothetical protein